MFGAMGAMNPQTLWLIANREKIFRYAFILQFFAAIPFLWLGYTTGNVQARLLLRSQTTIGTVVAVIPVHQYRTSSTGSFYSRRTSYELIVEFNDGSQAVRFQSWPTTSFAETVGSPVRVIYDPGHPLTAIVDRGYWNFIPWAPCLAIGGFLFLVAAKGLLTLLFRR